MKTLSYIFVIFVLINFSCEKKEQKSSNIDKNAIVVDFEGNEIPLPENKLIILNFMAYSCSSCMEEIPVMKKVLSLPDYKDRFVIIALAIDSKKNNLSDKMFPIYANNKINQVRFPVPGTPTTYIIDSGGKKLITIFGAITEENFIKFLNEALKKAESS